MKRREIDSEEDECYGCGINKCEVRLMSCQCRAMWCFPCLIRSFAAKQDYLRTPVNQWLQSGCECPSCRAKFNLLDISFFEE